MIIMLGGCAQRSDKTTCVTPILSQADADLQEGMQGSVSQAPPSSPDIEVIEVGQSSDSEEPHKEKILLDEVRAVITAPDQTVLITQIDTQRSMEGSPKTLRELVLEELMYEEAIALHISVTDDELDRRIQSLQKLNNNLTRDQIKEVFERMGYSYEEALETIRRREMVDRILEYRVRGSKALMVTRADVEEYFAAHPQQVEASVVLQQAFIQSTEPMDKFEASLRMDMLPFPIHWGEEFVLKKSELASEMLFVFEKEPGSIVIIDPVENGYEVTKLVEKSAEHIVPLDDAEYMRIDRLLKTERYATVLANYEQSLLSRATIKFTHEADRIAVMGE